MLVELGLVEQRYQAVLEVLNNASTVSDVAISFGVTRQTVHRWLRRYAADGISGLADGPARPLSCPHQMPADDFMDASSVSGDNLRGWECPDDQGRRPRHTCEFIYNSKVRTALGSICAATLMGIVACGDDGGDDGTAVLCKASSLSPP